MRKLAAVMLLLGTCCGSGLAQSLLLDSGVGEPGRSVGWNWAVTGFTGEGDRSTNDLFLFLSLPRQGW